tara:strand:+ start:432 stop:638 length:207 start_codon:yes stop_codon:yes gene_type:complete
MKFLILLPLAFSLFTPVYAEGHKKYKKEDFEKIKLMKIEYLNKKIKCLEASKNFKQMKKCWKNNKKNN